MDFIQRYESLCTEKKEAPTSIGTQLWFSKGTVSKWRSGKCAPRGKSLQRIADYFSVSVDYLLGKSDIRNAEVAVSDTIKAKQTLFGTENVPEKAWWEVEQFVEHTKRKYHLENR